MGKVVKAVALVGLALVAPFIIPSQILLPVVQGALLGAASRQLSKRSSKRAGNTVAPINVTVRGSTESRRVVFGKTRCGGVVVYYNTSGTNGKYLHYVVAYTGHQVNAVKDVYLDTNRILDANINAGTGAVTQAPMTGKLNIWRYTGTSTQSADSTLTSAFPGTWTSAHQLKGIAYAHYRLERSDDAFPSGAPQSFSAVIEGAKLYDPRLDSTNGGSGSHRYTDPTTWAYSTNPALILRWILCGGSVTTDVGTPHVKYGLKDSNSRINDAFTMAASNECDESITGASTTPLGDQSRYTCNVELTTGQPVREWLETVLFTMAGACVYVNGKWRIYAGAYDTPTHALTDADVFGDMEVQDTSPHSERYNAVSAVFRDSTQDYIEQTTQFRTDSTYETQDGGERLTKEIDLAGVVTDPAAQRLCEIEKRKSRLMRSVKFTGSLNLLKIAPWETFTLTYSKYGWTNRVFRCTERQFKYAEEAGVVELTAIVEASTVYTDMVTADYNNPNSHVAIYNIENPEPPTTLTTTGQLNGIVVFWTKSATNGVTYEVEQSSSSTMSSPTVVYAGADNQVFLYRSSTTAVYFRVRALKNGQYSTYEPATNGISGAASAVTTTLDGTASPTSASASGSSSSQTTGSVTVTPTGGTSPYTYAWTWASGGTGITINSTTAATTSFTSTSLTQPETRTGVARCTITDNVAATKTVDVSVSISRSAAFTVSVSATAVSGYSASSTVTSSSTTATPSGGTAPYTYSWAYTAVEGGTVTATASTSATTAFTGTGLISGEARIGTAVCTVTDNASNVATSPTVDVWIERL